MTVLNTFGINRWDVHVCGDVYIETGCGNGDSMQNALPQDFKAIIGIDVSFQACENCRKRFVSEAGRVQIWHGSSVEILPRVIDRERKTVFWLDAHYQPEIADSLDEKYGQCPLFQEIKVILEVDWYFKPVILIDDYAAFMSREVWWKRFAHKKLHKNHWPDWSTLYELMGGVDYKWNFLAADDGILYCW